MAEADRSLDEIEQFLSTAPGITPGEPQRIVLDLARHMIRQQRENDMLRAEVQQLRGEMLTPAKLAEHQKRFG